MVLVPELVDLEALAPPGVDVLLPCRGSGVAVDGAATWYLDQRPDRQPWFLVGCDRSREIHRWFYGEDAPGVDMCPRQLASSVGAGVRCSPSAACSRIASSSTAEGRRRSPGRRAVGRLAGPGPLRVANPRRDGRAGMGARLTDSAEYAHLWGTEEVRAIFDQDARRQTWIDILVALADAQAELGIIPRSSATTIADQARADRLDLDLLAAETRRTSHSTLGFIAALKAILPAEAAEHVYYGVTVQDVTDTWTVLASRRVMAVVWRDLRVLAGLLVDLARTHRTTVMVGRTHAQPGAPVTFGWKAASWADEIGRHLERVDEGRHRWLVGQLGGAVGTLGFFGDRGPSLRAAFCARLGLADPGISWLTSRDRLVEQSLPAGHGHRHAGPHRQRGDGAAADRDRRAAGGIRGVGRRQHHDAPQAQPGAQRAPGHAGPPHPGPRRGHARGDGAAPRARRPRVEGGVADLPGALPARRRARWRSPSTSSGPSRSTPTACGPTCSATTSSSPSRCWARTRHGWESTARRTSCRRCWPRPERTVAHWPRRSPPPASSMRPMRDAADVATLTAPSAVPTAELAVDVVTDRIVRLLDATSESWP